MDVTGFGGCSNISPRDSDVPHRRSQRTAAHQTVLIVYDNMKGAPIKDTYNELMNELDDIEKASSTSCASDGLATMKVVRDSAIASP